MLYDKFKNADPQGRYEVEEEVWYYIVNLGTGSKPRARLRAKELVCEQCGTSYMTGQVNKRTRRKFCPKKCSGTFGRENNLTPVGRKGEESLHWKGGELIHRSGYAYVWMPDHPELQGTQRKYIRRCRWVMEQQLGRQLYTWEEVHHLDGDKLNDDPSNLEVWITSHPAGIRAYCPRCECDHCLKARETA